MGRWQLTTVRHIYPLHSFPRATSQHLQGIMSLRRRGCSIRRARLSRRTRPIIYLSDLNAVTAASLPDT